MTYSPTNLCSTIGAVGLNFSVRDGKRWIPNAINRLNKGQILGYRTRKRVYSLLVYYQDSYANHFFLPSYWRTASLALQILKVWPKALTHGTRLI